MTIPSSRFRGWAGSLGCQKVVSLGRTKMPRLGSGSGMGIGVGICPRGAKAVAVVVVMVRRAARSSGMRVEECMLVWMHVCRLVEVVPMLRRDFCSCFFLFIGIGTVLSF